MPAPEHQQPFTAPSQACLGATIPIGVDASAAPVAAQRNGLAAALAASAAASATDAPGAEALVLAQRCIHSVADGLVAGEDERYEIHDLLGVGATGRVYAAHDRTLVRDVAIKALNAPARAAPALRVSSSAPSAARFLLEARIAAALAHPNILPVYDLDLARDGTPFFSMPRIAGSSLGVLIAGSAPGRRHAALADAAAVVRVAIGVTQALAYAHHHGIAHQDIKPDNILLGDFGEILLVDWGSALRLDDDQQGALYGTPLYMSPEQARAERIDARADIYCLGATLFHLLYLRPPTWSQTVEEFWARKRRGDVDEPDQRERMGVPAVLRAIVRKAMAPAASARYQDAQALLADLRAYQDGLAVTAHQESAFERLKRWHRRRWRLLYPGVAALALVATLIAALVGDRLAEIASWGEPAYSQDFSQANLPGWKPCNGAMVVRDGRYESQAPQQSTALLDRLWQGDLAVEYDARMLPGGPPGDVSLVWCRGRELSADGARVTKLLGRYRIQIGAFYNAYSGIYRENEACAAAPLRLQTDRTYHVRMELVGTAITLFVDGRHIVSWHEAFPITGGYLGLYACYPGKAYSHLRVWSRGLAARLPATAIGDALMRHGDIAGAAEEYHHAADSQRGGVLAEEAAFREGQCRWQLGDHDAARALWAGLLNGPHATAIRLRELDDAFAHGDHEAVRAELERIGRLGADDRHEAALAWAQYVDRLMPANPRDMPSASARERARYLDLHARAYTGEPAVDATAADALYKLGRLDELIALVPNMRLQVANALATRGRLREVLEDYRDCSWTYEHTLWISGEFIHHMPSESEYLLVEILYELGRLDYALTLPSCRGTERAQVLMRLGRLDEAAPLLVDIQGQAILAAFRGRLDQIPAATPELKALYGGHPELIDLARAKPLLRAQARIALRLRSAIAGDASALRGPAADGALEQVPELDDNNADDEIYRVHLALRSLFPLLRAIGGDQQPLIAVDAALRARDRLLGVQRYAWDADLILGRVDRAAYLAQPSRIFAEARAHLLCGLIAELHHQPEAARLDYRSYLAMPAWQRGSTPDPCLEELVSWRLRVLAR